MIDRVAHELAGEVEEGEHGPATGIALVMQLQSLGPRTAAATAAKTTVRRAA